MADPFKSTATQEDALANLVKDAAFDAALKVATPLGSAQLDARRYEAIVSGLSGALAQALEAGGASREDVQGWGDLLLHVFDQARAWRAAHGDDLSSLN